MKFLHMTPKNRNATLGLMVATSLSLYLIVRLVQATSPAPTSIHLTNLGPDALAVTDLRIRGESVLQGQVTLRPASGGGSAPVEKSNVVNIAAGLPLEVEARLSGQASQVSCALTPRPQGVCVIRAVFASSSNMQCEYECKTEVSK